MSSKDQKDNKKIRQFQWYEVQTKVRQIMSQLLQPFNKKQTQDTIKMNEMKRIQATVLKKMQDHDFLLERQEGQKPTYVQLQDDKIGQIWQKANQTHVETHAAIKRMEAIIAVYEEKINQLNSLQRRVDKEVVERVSQFCKFKESIDSEVALMVKRQGQQIEEVNQFKNITKGAVSKMQTRMITFDNRLKQLQDDHRHRVSDIKKLMEDMVGHKQIMTKIENKVGNLTLRVQDRQRDTKLSEKFFSKVKDMEGDMKFINTYLEQYLPLYTQMMISDTMDSFLQGKQRRRLCIFQEKLFAKLHQHILINQKTTLPQAMASYSNSIRKIINRNKKYVVHLAVKDSIKYGGNIYQFRIQNLADMEDDDDQKKNVAPSVDPEVIIGIIEEKLSGFEDRVTRQVKEELNPTRTWMNQLQEQTILRSLQYDNKYQQLKKSLASMSSHQELEQKHIQQQFSKLSLQQELIQTSVNTFKEYVKDILNFSSVINHIVIQDQIDRQGTALYALRANKPEQGHQPTFQLDPSCISCQNRTSAIIQQAFKMACLTYNPSQIKIDSQTFSRQEILEISTGILQKLKKRLWNNQFSKLPQQRRSPRAELPSSEAKSQSKRKSFSTLKDSSIARHTVRQKQFQTLLPTLGSGTSRPQRRHKNQLSVFY